MLRLLCLSLTIVQWFPGSLAQTCGPCIGSCSGITNSRCCQWDNPPIESEPASLIEPGRSPNGFTTAFLPRVESNDPFPCVTVLIPEPTKQTYIQVSVESNTQVCVHEDSDSDDKACQEVLHFCDPDGYNNESSVTFRFDCESCPPAETSFFFKIDLQTLDKVDEDWCDNTNRTLPSDLIQDGNTAFTPSDISQPEVFTESAHLFLIDLTLLVISLLIAVLSL